MAAEASDCDYCNSYIQQDYVSEDMNRDFVLEMIQNILYENSNGEKQYKKWEGKIPQIPQDLFTYAPDELDESGELGEYDGSGSGKKSVHANLKENNKKGLGVFIGAVVKKEGEWLK